MFLNKLKKFKNFQCKIEYIHTIMFDYNEKEYNTISYDIQILYLITMSFIAIIVIFNLINNLDTSELNQFTYTKFKNKKAKFNKVYLNELINIININDSIQFLPKKEYIELLDEIYKLTLEYTNKRLLQTQINFTCNFIDTYIVLDSIILNENESIIIYENEVFPVVVFTKKHNEITKTLLKVKDYDLELKYICDDLILEQKVSEIDTNKHINLTLKFYTLV